jgi:hypothetical protein
MKPLICFIIVWIICFNSVAESQSLPGYWATLKKGPFTVGFKSLCVFDTSRKYDLTCGDSTVIIKNKNSGRPILINIWYPAKRTNDISVLKVKDYFNFPVNENANFFFTKLKAYQFENSKFYSIEENMEEEIYDGNSSSYEKAKASAFESYMASSTISHKDLKAEDGEFPVIIYHQGSGGTIDENSLLLEYLASNGYITINSAFQESDGSGFIDGWAVGVGDQRATFDDINFIINYCKQHAVSKSKKFFLMGHSFGANSSISFLGEGHKNVDGIIPIDSDFGYVLYSFYPSKYNPFAKDKLKFYNIPVFCVGRSEAHFKMIDSLSLSKRYHLTIAGMVHNDFASQGATGRYYCLPYIKEKKRYKQITENYLNMCSAILQFLNVYTKTGAELEKKDIHLYDGWKFEVSKPGDKLPGNMPFDESTGQCPTISQFIDLMYSIGPQKSGKIYTQCTDSSFKQDKTLLDILDALYSDAGVNTIIEYLNWMKEQKIAENNISEIFFIVSNNSLSGRSNSRPYEKADSIYKWMIEKFPANKYGYIGRLLVSSHTGSGDKEFYCKKIVGIEPNFANTKARSYFEDEAKRIIHDCLKKD